MAGRYQKRNSGATAARNIAIVFGLGVASFGIGFFIFAKLLPGQEPAPNANTAVAQTASQNVTPPAVTSTPANSTTGTAASAAAAPSTPAATVPPPSAVNPNGEALHTKTDAGPLLENDDRQTKKPSEEVKAIQKPEGSTPTDKPSMKVDVEQTTAPKSSGETHSSSAVRKAADASADEDQPAPRKRRRPRRTDAETQPETSAPVESPDGSATREATTRKASNSEAEPKRLYRLQVNAYSTEDAAQREVASLQGKNVKSRIRKVTRAGKTLYSVSHGAYSTKEKAQEAQAKLKELGVDAYISQR